MASKPDRGPLGPVATPRINQIFTNYFAETVIISAVFYLVLFGLLLVTELSVPTPELVFIALVPFLVLLIASGRLQELRFGDLSMKFQQAVQSGIVPELESEPFKVEPEDVASKGGRDRLETMIDNQSSTLAFRIGGRYDIDFIYDYLERNLKENPNFRYVLFSDLDGQFRGLMQASDFVSYVWLQDAEDDGVVDAIQQGDILNEPGVVKDRIQEGSTLGEARQKMNAATVDTLAVVNTDEEFVGVLSRESVASKLLTRLVGEQG